MPSLTLDAERSRRAGPADAGAPGRGTAPGSDPSLCFARGTAIATPDGPRAVEALSPGDMVLTRDNGPRPVRCIGSRTVDATGGAAPVVIAAGALGNDRELIVGQRQGLMVAGWRAELMFGDPEVLAAAGDLADGRTIRIIEGGRISYYQLILDRHEIVSANGAPSGSFHPGERGIGWMAVELREAICAALPRLRGAPDGFGPVARITLSGREARALRR